MIEHGKPCDLNAKDKPDPVRILGYRAQGPYVAWPMTISPAECGYVCPICPPIDGTDQQLAWGQLNGIIYCQRCERDYPSPLCLPGAENIDYAIDIFLRIVRAAQDFGPNFITPPDQGGPTLDKPESFFDAVRNDPDMTPAQKAHWLSEFHDAMEAAGVDLGEVLPTISEADQIADEQADRFKDRKADQ